VKKVNLSNFNGITDQSNSRFSFGMKNIKITSNEAEIIKI